jgi:hypothetical protein
MKKLLLCVSGILGAGALLAIALYVVQAFTVEPSIELTYVLPNGFRGELSLYKNDPNGGPSRPRGGVQVLDFTRSARVSVSGDDPLRGWCRQSARYANGLALEIFRSAEKYSAEVVLLDHEVAESRDTPSAIFVGTAEEIMKARNDRLQARLKSPRP